MTDRMERDEKAYIRREMTQKRNLVTPEQRKSWSEAACAKAQLLLESRSARSFMVYVPFRSELDLSKLIEWGWETGKTVIVPRCLAADRSMTLHSLKNWDELASGAYGIMEPDPAISPLIDHDYLIDAIFVPGLAFDHRGGRLGYGGGYYDRFAESRQADLKSSAATLWIGTAFEMQLIEHVPLEDHDLPMDGILTEQHIYMLEAIKDRE